MLVNSNKNNQEINNSTNNKKPKSAKEIGLATLAYCKSIFTTHSKAFDFLLIVLFIMTVILIWVPNSHDTFYNCNTDDIVQYYPYVANFFERIKTGQLSFYDVTLYGGASYFASTYYIPIDLFLLLAFFLSNFLTVELSYYITLLLKIMCGAMILFYVFKRKNFKPGVCFIIALIYTQTAVTETCFVFPVYLGISFYAPLAMLLVDLFLEKKDRIKGVIFIPLYVLNCIIFDFYIAYMLVAFMCVFFVVEACIYQKGFFLFKKDFWINFLTFMSLIFIGLALSACYLMPSALYIMNESSRASSSVDYFWYYSSSHYDQSSISVRHYFTQFVNYFIPNNPFRLCLISAGDYIREHGTLYMTSGGIIYLFYFFTLRGFKNHKLKIWVGILNIMYLIPIFAMIFSLSTWAYLRWFFIPYLINVYAMAVGMNETEFVIGKSRPLALVPVLMMLVGFGLLFYTVIKSPDIFIHYQASSQGESSSSYFYGILVTELIFIGTYLLLLIIPHTWRVFYKYNKYITGAIPFVIALEVVFAAVITFSSIGSESYSETYAETKEDVDYVKTNLGYDVTDGYRINLYTGQKGDINANIKYGNVNPTSFFQSFYNTPLDAYLTDIQKQSASSWTRRSIHGYSLLEAPMFNTKYVITSADVTEVRLTSKYYTLYKDPKDTSLNYYVLNDTVPFIVYDSLMNQTASSLQGDEFINSIALLSNGYVKTPDEAFELVLDNYRYETLLNAYDENNHTLTNGTNTVTLSKTSIRYMNTIKKLYDSGFDFNSYYNVYNAINNEQTKRVTISSEDYRNGYYNYDLTTISNYESVLSSDAVYLVSYDKSLAKHYDYHAYFRDPDDSSLRPFHYNTFFNDTYNMMPSELIVRADNSNSISSLRLYGFDYDIYDNFIESQNAFTNKEFKLDGSSMHIAFKNPTTSKPRVVKTAYAYSDDWKIKDNTLGYETIDIDGGFLGIIIPSDVTDVSIDLYYSPYGYKEGLKVSIVGLLLYFGITATVLVLEINKRKKRGIVR